MRPLHFLRSHLDRWMMSWSMVDSWVHIYWLCGCPRELDCHFSLSLEWYVRIPLRLFQSPFFFVFIQSLIGGFFCVISSEWVKILRVFKGLVWARYHVASFNLIEDSFRVLGRSCGHIDGYNPDFYVSEPQIESNLHFDASFWFMSLQRVTKGFVM